MSVYDYVLLPMFIFFRTWETNARKCPVLRMAGHTKIVVPVFEPQTSDLGLGSAGHSSRLSSDENTQEIISNNSADMPVLSAFPSCHVCFPYHSRSLHDDNDVSSYNRTASTWALAIQTCLGNNIYIV